MTTQPTTHRAQTLGTAAQLRNYTEAVLTQMTSVIQPYVGASAADYAGHLGAHMRHIIEHYDTLAKAVRALNAGVGQACVADYDARERNLLVEGPSDSGVGLIRQPPVGRRRHRDAPRADVPDRAEHIRY